MMNFEDITLKIEQINSIAYALEGAMIEAEGHGPDDKELLTHPVLFVEKRNKI